MRLVAAMLECLSLSAPFFSSTLVDPLRVTVVVPVAVRTIMLAPLRPAMTPLILVGFCAATGAGATTDVASATTPMQKHALLRPISCVRLWEEGGSCCHNAPG